VKSQYEKERARLQDTENQLLKFETENATSFLELQRTRLDSAVIASYHQGVSIEDSVRRVNLKLEELNFSLSSVDDKLYEQITRDDQRFMVGDISLSRALVDSHLKTSLQFYDAHYEVEAVRQQLKGSALDSLRLKISYLNKELQNHNSTLGGGSNPTFVMLSDQLSALRLEYEFAKPLNENGISQEETTLGGTRTIGEALNILQRREILIQRNSIIRQLNVLSRLKIYHEKQLLSLKASLDSIKKELSAKVQNQQRLHRDQELLRGTVTRFSTLHEEARVAREKAAGDIRVLTRALDVRQIPQEQGQQKTAIAAGVGFLLSSILSLLLEYIRKARQKRAEATNS